MFGKKKTPAAADNPWGSPQAAGDNFWGATDSPPDSPSAAPGPAEQPTTQHAPVPASPGVPQTVPELVEPVFLFVFRTHRLVREGRELSYQKVRYEAEEMLGTLESVARKSPTIQQQFEKLREPIYWFIDYWFGSSGEFRAIQKEWNMNRLGEEPDGGEDGMLTGDEAFFVELDKTLKTNPTDSLANERLTFFYTALGSGFHGPYYRSTPQNEDILRDYMAKMYPRVREFIDADPSGRVTPEAYEATDRRDFIAPIRDRPMVLFCSLLCLVMTLLLGYFWLYGQQKEKLETYLKDLQNTSERIE